MRKKKRKVARKHFIGPPPEVMDIKTLAQYLSMGRSQSEVNSSPSANGMPTVST